MNSCKTLILTLTLCLAQCNQHIDGPSVFFAEDDESSSDEVKGDTKPVPSSSSSKSTQNDTPSQEEYETHIKDKENNEEHDDREDQEVKKHQEDKSTEDIDMPDTKPSESTYP